MTKFVKHSNGKIIDTSSKRYVSEKYIYRMHKLGNKVTYVEAMSDKDIMPKLLSRYENKNYKLKKDDPELGPFTPLNEVKYYNCQNCDTLTPNRFKCSSCWEKMSDVTAGYFDSYDYSVSSDLGIV